MPKLMNKSKIKIFDENFIPVTICKKTNEIYDYNFTNPFLVINSFEARNYKDIQIKPIDLDEIDKLGYRLIAIKLKGMNRNRRNYIGQKTAYTLRKKTEPLGRDIEMYRLPANHQLQIDLVNKRLRIQGRDACPYIRNENASKWIEVVEVKLKKPVRER